MSLPPTWPINFPGRCITRCPLWSTPEAKQVIQYLEPGDDFMVISNERTVLIYGGGHQNLIRIQLPRETDGRAGPFGFVLRASIEIGRTTDMLTEMALVLPPRPPPPTLVWDDQGTEGPKSVFGKTIRGLVEQNYKHREDLPQHNLTLDDLTTTAIRDKVAHTIWTGFNNIPVEKQSLAMVLEKKDFHIKDLKKIKEIHRKGMLPCGLAEDSNILYAEILSDFAGEPAREDECYGGRTNRPQKRKREHVDAAEEVARLGNRSKYGRSAHYRAAATAGKRRMVPVCILPKDWKYTFLAEQILNQLLQLYCKGVLNYGRTATTPDPDVAAANYWQDSEIAWTMQEIATKVFKETGWPGGTKRSPDLPPFGCSVGLMWKSPIADAVNYLPSLYTRSKAGKYLLFRRSPVTSRKSISLFSFEIAVTQATQHIPPGSLYYPVIELTESGEAHPKTWACLPDCYGTSDVQLANSWALRLEWFEGSSWKTSYVQRDYMTIPKKVCAFTMYSTGILINHRLRNTTFTPGPGLEFLSEINPTRLRMIAVDTDKLTRTVRVSRFNDPPRRTANNPRLFTASEVAERYQAIIAADTSFSFNAGDRKRHTCDFHSVNMLDNKDCRTDCKQCALMNAVCTFTPTRSIPNSKLEAFLAAAVPDRKIYDVPDPGLQTYDVELLPDDI